MSPALSSPEYTSVTLLVFSVFGALLEDVICHLPASWGSPGLDTDRQTVCYDHACDSFVFPFGM